MTAQPSGPAHGPDTGSYEVIHLGGHAAGGAGGRTSCVPADEVWQRLGLTR